MMDRGFSDPPWLLAADPLPNNVDASVDTVWVELELLDESELDDSE
jgi:hypothetical protein